MATSESNKLFILEKVLFFIILGLCIWGFWYFEGSLILRIATLILGSVSLYLVFLKVPSKTPLPSKLELGALLILYLGIFSLYNFLYSLNLPLPSIMVAILLLVSGLCFSVLSLDRANDILGKEIYRTFIILMGIVILEIFLSLYFWPIGPEAKTLIIVVIFYLIMSLIYLYIHSMLRLKRVLGYLVIGVLIIGTILITVYLQLPK